MDHGTCVIGEGDCSKTGKLTLGWCPKCYQRIRRNGDPAIVKRIFGDIEARFWSHVDRRGDDECWLWTASVDDSGYATFGADRKVVKVHTWAYEHFIGPVPEDRPELDHDCHSRVRETCPGGTSDLHRRCVNFLQDVSRPHLKPVTKHQNSQLASTTKYQDEYVLGLRVRWVAGERAELLAEEAGTSLAYLYRLFSRPAVLALEAVTYEPQEPPTLFDAAS